LRVTFLTGTTDDSENARCYGWPAQIQAVHPAKGSGSAPGYLKNSSSLVSWPAVAVLSLTLHKDDVSDCRLRFPERYEDEEAGLYYNRFWYYDCGTGSISHRTCQG
ncbi:TPA: hypothetical protein ACIFST_005057, partial [Citrobacter farmeri]